MPRITKAILTAENDRLSKEAGVNLLILNSLIDDDVLVIKGEHDYTARLARLDAGHGGVIAVTFHPEGQRPHTSGHYLEEWLRETSRRSPLGDDPLVELSHLVRETVYRHREAERWAASS